MRIVHIAAGAAGMYCGSCLHDNTLAAALIDVGEDVLLVPTYTPIRTDEVDVSYPRVFFGGINVALQQKWPFFRHTPWWLDRLFDRPSFLARLARRSASTSPELLGELTVSMLQGEQGRQKKELDKLTTWLDHEIKPDVVHLSNTLLAGMARQLKRLLNVPVVSTLSGEDNFIEKLTSPYYQRVRDLLQKRCHDIDAFVALNKYYADFMSEYLAVQRDRIHVIPHGLRLDGHGTRQSGEGEAIFTIGFLARVCPDKGLHLLAEAFTMLAESSDTPPVQLKVAGYLGGGDKDYLDNVRQHLADRQLIDRYQYLGELNRKEKIAFLQSLDVLCVPTIYRESKGLPALEALANAVPVVLPAHGSFPELIGDTDGGLLFTPREAPALAEVLGRLARDPHQAHAYGKRGQQVILERYHASQMAERTRELYRGLRLEV